MSILSSTWDSTVFFMKINNWNKEHSNSIIVFPINKYFPVKSKETRELIGSFMVYKLNDDGSCELAISFDDNRIVVPEYKIDNDFNIIHNKEINTIISEVVLWMEV